jgi:hypothetical protein
MRDQDSSSSSSSSSSESSSESEGSGGGGPSCGKNKDNSPNNGEDNGNNLRCLRKTRTTTFVDEDLKQISEFLKDPTKGIKKLKTDYYNESSTSTSTRGGGGDRNNKDSDEELKIPKTVLRHNKCVFFFK